MVTPTYSAAIDEGREQPKAFNLHSINILRFDTQGCDLSDIKALELRLEKDQLLCSFINCDAAQESRIMSAFEHEAARVPAAAAGKLRGQASSTEQTCPLPFLWQDDAYTNQEQGSRKLLWLLTLHLDTRQFF